MGTPENGLDSGTWVYFPSDMTSGSSGAPVLTRFADGTWGIFGVVNRGVDTHAQNRRNFVGRSQMSIMLDDRFVSFFNSVVGLVRAMPRGRGAAGPFEVHAHHRRHGGRRALSHPLRRRGGGGIARSGATASSGR